jgi:hypothetical protein
MILTREKFDFLIFFILLTVPDPVMRSMLVQPNRSDLFTFPSTGTACLDFYHRHIYTMKPNGGGALL